MVMVDFKTKRKYKIKKERDITFEKIVTLRKSLFKDELLGDEVQNLKDLVGEEARNGSSLKE
jgi:hypothetical protein